MATLAEQRRGSGASMETSRRAIGQNNTAARRAIGTSMEAQRRGRGLVDDLNSVVTPTEQGRVLSAIEARGARSVARGIADYKPPVAGGKGGGVASPLIEASYLERTYWPEKVITSTDGVFSFKVKPIKQIRQLDANDAEVIQQFAQPEEAP
ncbi:hypothetical protein [Pseudomonas denitrificans (nom. rej.)]|uniref:Uncharacterized protein n=1 Tax=Pseudomonas denitrificans TaxID=43306 RepID=A0A9X7N103_PSEDE|nr:hypothetical protein [Pseudomonas denitrificans (nom. rej.)]QEY73217.1 hypothetical protein F1C79_17270 [Pseudomonas denitrificans (nom. rej.)]